MQADLCLWCLYAALLGFLASGLIMISICKLIITDNIYVAAAAPITQLHARTCVIKISRKVTLCDKSKFQGRSPNVIKVIFLTIRNCS